MFTHFMLTVGFLFSSVLHTPVFWSILWPSWEEYIHRAQSVSRTAPAVLLRSLVCPTCQQKALGSALAQPYNHDEVKHAEFTTWKPFAGASWDAFWSGLPCDHRALPPCLPLPSLTPSEPTTARFEEQRCNAERHAEQRVQEMPGERLVCSVWPLGFVCWIFLRCYIMLYRLYHELQKHARNFSLRYHWYHCACGKCFQLFACIAEIPVMLKNWRRLLNLVICGCWTGKCPHGLWVSQLFPLRPDPTDRRTNPLGWATAVLMTERAGRSRRYYERLLFIGFLFSWCLSCF